MSDFDTRDESRYPGLPPAATPEEVESRRVKRKKEMTLADHAEAWQRERGREVPPRDSEAWEQMYAEWIEFAFEGF